MSNSLNAFNSAISDAKELIECYDYLNKDENFKGSDALKRSALIMALTAWETYVEDVVIELFELKFGVLRGSQIGSFMEKQLEIKLKTFHNPNSAKTKQIFEEFFGFDVTKYWEWDNFNPPSAREQLNKWISKRGDAVHRAQIDNTQPHIVKREDLDKCVRFFVNIVRTTDKALNL
ncbi:hypothetical protein JCM30760_07570 [Thiomicrorhabdus hydrogeniphila]